MTMSQIDVPKLPDYYYSESAIPLGGQNYPERPSVDMMENFARHGG
jgi:hypothetical protein